MLKFFYTKGRQNYAVLTHINTRKQCLPVPFVGSTMSEGFSSESLHGISSSFSECGKAISNLENVHMFRIISIDENNQIQKLIIIFSLKARNY